MMLRQLTLQYLKSPFGDKVRSIIDFLDLRMLSCPGELDVDSLRQENDFDLSALFNAGEVHIQWERAGLQLKKILGHDRDAGERRALYYLVAHFKPVSVLEIGCGDGNMTAALALALKDFVPESTLTAIDPTFTNKPQKKLNPTKLVATTEFENFEYIQADGTGFFENTNDTYDLIVLNGQLAPRDLYLATHSALRSLNVGGLLLYTGYYPDGKPIYADKRFTSSTYVTMTRLCAENPRLDILSLGSLPWPTKSGSMLSTLALLVIGNEEAEDEGSDDAPTTPQGA